MPATVTIGSVYRRRVQPATDDGWSKIIVIGFFEQKEMTEVAVRQADAFGPVLSMPVADLQAAWTLEAVGPADPEPSLADIGQAWV